MVKMIFHGIERELLNGLPWLFGQQSQLPHHLQLTDQQEDKIRDIWEFPPQESADRQPVVKQEIKQFGIFSKLKSFSLKAIANK
ncbi:MULTISPECIES: hypothetical protein [unclassified Nostoc]|uniref:hypothetical protein n=1 Tax=unclassified Nostoc TaxID=2593658 RepID=UPI002AD54669|nr:hypothetical protein [Nostoc sp. DedQUE03]MDZ7976418.1 hypothetical protein [Nostoc sp. DedQUE03]MDZ8042741.1 hypothetical protein [Nostoc sp. DedQUE02]